jgi:hypothetical protein
LKPTGVPVKEIKKNNSSKVLGEKQISRLLVLIQKCDFCEYCNAAFYKKE